MEILSRTSDGLKRAYVVFLSQKELDGAEQIQLQQIAKRVKLHGFRPGKVPLNIIKKMYGASVVAESKKKAIDDTVIAIFKEEQLNPFLGYKYDILKEDEKGIEFEVKFELKPEVELKDMSSIELTKLVVPVTEEPINKVLENIRQHTPYWCDDVDATEVKNSGKIVVDLSIINGPKKLKKYTGEVEIEMESPHILDVFRENLVGAKIGEVRQFSVKYPDSFGDKTLAGKNITYSANVKKILKSYIADLDDDFAKKCGYDNLEKMKEWARDYLSASYDKTSRDILKRDLMEKIAQMYDFPVPDSMVNLEQKNIRMQLESEAKRLGKEFNSKVEEGCTKLAVEKIRVTSVLMRLAKEYNVEATNQEIDLALRNVASMYPGREKAVIDTYVSKPEMLHVLVASIKENKVIDILLEKVKIKEKEVSFEELKARDEETFDFFQDEGDKAGEDKSQEPKKATKKAASEPKTKQSSKKKAVEASSADTTEEEKPAPKKRAASTKKSSTKKKADVAEGE